MTRTRLSALFLTIWFTGLVPGDVCQNVGISVWQISEIIANEGTDVIIPCHINADLHVKRIMVKWFRENQTELMDSPNKSVYPSPVNGSMFIKATLHLQSIRLNHSGLYYCTAQEDLPKLGSVEHGKGTHVYVVPTNVTHEVSPNHYNMDTVMWSVLSGMGFVLLIISIACVIRIHYKENCRLEGSAKEALVDATRGSPCPDTRETVVYAAINIPRDSVKSRNENCPAPTLTSVTCTEESVTYSEVRLKKGPKDEG